MRLDALPRLIANKLQERKVVLEGELICLDREGRPDFWSLLFGPQPAKYFAFDLLSLADFSAYKKPMCAERTPSV